MTSPFLISRDQLKTLALDDPHRLHPLALLDLVDVLHAGRHLPEHGVVVVEVRLGAVRDVELAPGGVRMLRARHGERAADVLLLVELGLDLVSRPARAVALGVAALHDEPRHDAVELQSVVESLLRERHEVLDGLRRVLGEELDGDLPALLERDDGSLLHVAVLSTSKGASTAPLESPPQETARLRRRSRRSNPGDSMVESRISDKLLMAGRAAGFT